LVIVAVLDSHGRALVATPRRSQLRGIGTIYRQEVNGRTLILRDWAIPSGRALLAALPAVFADFEREVLRERVRTGITQARREGPPHCRPRTASPKADDVRRLKAERVSHSEIARRLGIGRTSVRRILTAG
jgi:DNA invertase Pin-like site-specific DNA recombinase